MPSASAQAIRRQVPQSGALAQQSRLFVAVEVPIETEPEGGCFLAGAGPWAEGLEVCDDPTSTDRPNTPVESMSRGDLAE